MFRKLVKWFVVLGLAVGILSSKQTATYANPAPEVERNLERDKLKRKRLKN